MSYEIRPLQSMEECRQVAALEREIWGYADAEDVVPPPVLIVSAKRGGILLGAFDEAGTMQGFVYSIPALKHGRLTQWSHMTGVAPGAQGSGLGFRLKLAQRAAALEQGVDLIEWTFDPLQALNARFNFTKLGVVVEEHEENVYGESSSVLHRGTPTDRFIAEWQLTAPHVLRRIGTGTLTLPEQPGSLDVVDPSAPPDASRLDAPIVNPSRAGERWLRPGPADLTVETPRLLVEIPVGFSEMQQQDPGLALEWRLATRRIFQHYLPRGYRVVDFFLSRETLRGQYLLALSS